MSSMLGDVRHAIRSLLRAPTLTGAAVLCLGLGIGATTAIYTAVHTALLRPLPVPAPERLVTIFRTTPHFQSGPFSPANFLDLRRETRSLETVAAVTPGVVLLQGTDESAQVTANRASGNLFSMLRVRPLAGRLLQEADEGQGQPQVAVLSEELWRDRLGADPGVVGRTVRLDGVEHEVVGILQRDFRLPHGNNVLRSDVWVPLRFSPEQATARRNNFLMLMGRLRPGVDVAAADAEMRGLMDGIVEANPVLRGEQLRVLPLHEASVAALRGSLLLLLGAVGFVLLIAAANVASLLLARGVARRGEWAMRAVLGAARWDVLRPALLESAILTAAGAGLGIGLAWAGVEAIRAYVPTGLPQLADLAVAPEVLAFALALAVIVALLAGVAPAWQAQRADPQEALRSDGRTGASRRHHRFLRILVTAEVALSLVLLLGAGLVFRGFESLVSQDPGFDPEPILTLTVNVPPDAYGDASAIDAFLTPALERIRALPGVQAAGTINLIPYTNWGWNFNIRYEGQPGDDPTTLPLTETRYATRGFFETLGMTLLRGRLFEPSDDGDEGRPLVVVANQALVDRDFPGQDPIGKRFHRGDTTFATIVGVVSDIRNVGPFGDPQPEVYWHFPQAGWGSAFPILLRVSGDPMSYAPQVRAAILDLQPGAAISEVRTMPEVIAASMGRPRFYLVLMGIFATVAMALALAGLYGVMSYSVAQRRREIGIRTALGSTPGSTVKLVLTQGLKLVAAGTVLGLLGAFGLTRLLTGLLYGVSPLDAVTWLLVPALLATAAGAALLLPARRASTVDPLVAMRTE